LFFDKLHTMYLDSARFNQLFADYPRLQSDLSVLDKSVSNGE